MPYRRWFELARLPLALAGLLILGIVLVPRGSADDGGGPPSTPTVVVGPAAGEVLTTGAEPAGSVEPGASGGSVAPEPTEAATPEPTPAPTADATPAPATGGSVTIVACRSISGSTCNGRLSSVPSDLGSFVALVRFDDSNAGDTIEALLRGPSGTYRGGPFTIRRGGGGYYYSTYSTGGLAPGSYTLIATRNGTEIATAPLRIGN